MAKTEQQDNSGSHWRAHRLRKCIEGRRRANERAAMEQGSGKAAHARDAMALRALQVTAMLFVPYLTYVHVRVIISALTS